MKTINARTVRSVATLALLSTAPLAAGCASASDEGGMLIGDRSPSHSARQNTYAKGEIPSAPAEDVRQVVQGNTQFAIDLYRQINETVGPKENIFFAPQSVSTALAMTYAGAKGATGNEIAKALHFNLEGEKLHAAFGNLNARLVTSQQEKDGVVVRNANGLFGERTLKPLSEFVTTLTRNYGADFAQLDFKNAAEASRTAINRWVSDATDHRISTLMPEGSITTISRVVIANAMTFVGSWKSAFDATLTKPAQFHLADGSETTVKVMHKRLQDSSYYENDLFQSVRIDCTTDAANPGGPAYQLVVALPRAGKLEQFEGAMSAGLFDQLGTVTSALPSHVDLSLPKFKIDMPPRSLRTELIRLGVDRAFSEAANFSGISGEELVNLSDVLHTATITVDEKGAVASAATGGGAITTSYPSTVREINVDRPFFVLIREANTGAIAFMGRVADVR